MQLNIVKSSFSFKLVKMAHRLRISYFKNLLRFSFQDRKQNAISVRNFSIGSTLSSFWDSKPLIFKITAIASGFGLGSIGFNYLTAPDRKSRRTNVLLTEKTDSTAHPSLVNITPSREISGPANDLGLDLLLFQYQTCPFCCKVRAFLEFYGIPYQVVEVNPVMRQQLKFSNYKKVPILVAQEKNSTSTLQLNDSSVIISILGTFLTDLSENLESILKYYAPMLYTDNDGKVIEEVMNKYFIMYGEKAPSGRSDELLKQERKWRKWADTEFVHIISPNIYRTYDEALQAFNYFSEVGEWEKNFSTLERLVVIYVGATAMFFVGKRLKKKYSLKEDVRQSMYDACKQWTKAIGSKKKFMGGDMPNLADLAIYGMLSSIEGCVTFQDLLTNTNIGPWYYSMKTAVTNHEGYELLKAYK